MSALASLASLGKPIVNSNLLKGLTSEFMPYSHSLVPGVFALISGGYLLSQASKAKTLPGRALVIVTGLGAGAVGVLNLGFFLWQADCLGGELKACFNTPLSEKCHVLPLLFADGSGDLRYVYKRDIPSVDSKCAFK